VCSVTGKPADRPADSAPQDPTAATGKASGAPPRQPDEQPKTLTLQELVEAANQGSAAALKALRHVLDEHPEIWQKAGNLAAHAEQTWTRLVADGNALALESIRREAERLRGTLLGPCPSPIERLLVDQIVACWLQAKHAEVASASQVSSVIQARFRDQRLDRAQRRYLSAMKTLSQIRGLTQSLPAAAMSRAGASTPPGKARQNAAGNPCKVSPVEPHCGAQAATGGEPPLRIFPESRSREAV